MPWLYIVWSGVSVHMRVCIARQIVRVPSNMPLCCNYPSIYPCIFLSLPVCLSFCLSVCPCTCLSVYLSVCESTYLSTCLSSVSAE